VADLFLEIEANPNCEMVEGMMYHALEPPRPVIRMQVTHAGREAPCWVTGVEPPDRATGREPRWVPALARKITDSGAGIAWCVYGGRWGLRFQPTSAGPPVWDLRNLVQWGEPYKIYGDASNVVFGAP